MLCSTILVTAFFVLAGAQDALTTPNQPAKSKMEKKTEGGKGPAAEPDISLRE